MGKMLTMPVIRNCSEAQLGFTSNNFAVFNTVGDVGINLRKTRRILEIFSNLRPYSIVDILCAASFVCKPGELVDGQDIHGKHTLVVTP